MKIFRTILSGIFLLSSWFRPLLGACAFLFQWIAAFVCVGVLAFAFIEFGSKLERAAFFYARGQSQQTLHALYETTKWAAIVEGKNRQIDLVCKRLSKKQKKGVCPVEGV